MKSRKTAAFGGLVWSAPVVLLVGATVVGLDARKKFHAHATRLGNAERRLSDMKEQGRDWARKLNRLNSQVDRLSRKISEIDKRLKNRERDYDRADEAFSRGLYETQSLAVRVAAAQDIALQDFLSEEEASKYLQVAATREDFLGALPVIRSLPSAVNALSLTHARTLMKGMRQLGYLEETATLMVLIAAKSGKESDFERATFFRSEFEMYSGINYPMVDLPDLEGEADSKTVLHFVGKALPETQTGYTLRTHYTVEAQQRAGINPVVVAQSGASTRPHGETERYLYKGIHYYLLGGPQRNKVPWDQWLADNIKGLAEQVREIRPSILHAHSDFLNALIVQTVGDAYGIPVINETRGFWEESWLSRKANAEGWKDLAQIEKIYGLPTAYTLRKEREAECRSKAKAVITLADVMRDHIETVAFDYGKPVKQISIVPNAVESDLFPLVSKNDSLLDHLKIPADTIVIGYISSIVEYEGIDVLIRAFYELVMARHVSRNMTNSEARIEELSQRLARVHPSSNSSNVRQSATEALASINQDANKEIHLLIVGDGIERVGLEEVVRELGIADAVTFTGRVPHEQILDYYSVIDLFVVPRKPTTVTELVTPLKPFEAMSTGRPCIFSDVGALAEIANHSGAAATFKAGDHHDLALTMSNLLNDPAEMVRMSEQGSVWVRDSRTWDSNADKYLDVYNSLGLEVGEGMRRP